MLAALAAYAAPRQARPIGVAASLVTLALTAGVVLAAGDAPARHLLGGWGAPLGIDLYLDGLALVMLAMTGVVGMAVSVYATSYFGTGAAARAFWPLWLFLWGALNALFLSGDAFNLYVTLELVGIAAVALVALAGGRAALAGALRYLLVSLAGSLAYLLGVALLYAEQGTVDLVLLAGSVERSPAALTAAALMTAGLVMKTALFPLHFWLPPAHGGAPAPVSAALSALVVKASFYLLLRLWGGVLEGLDAPGFGLVLGVLGAMAVLWGSWQALQAERLKILVAYSTVAQVGYLFLVFPLLETDAAATAWYAVLLFALAHASAKAAMFFAAGTVMKVMGHDRIDDLDGGTRVVPVSLFAVAMAGVSLIGLPPSGGFVAKWMLLNAALVSGQWWWAVVLVLGTLLAAAYIFRVLGHLVRDGNPATLGIHGPGPMKWSALALATLALVLGLLAGPIVDLAAMGGPPPGPELIREAAP
jgi:formate hydrogenlyase subunit 3/multisubunit Na+/H+ antiporter MnhD subunit